MLTCEQTARALRYAMYPSGAGAQYVSRADFQVRLGSRELGVVDGLRQLAQMRLLTKLINDTEFTTRRL